MTTENSNGAPAPEVSTPTPAAPGAQFDAQVSQPRGESAAPQPEPQSADAQRLTAIEREISSLERLAADATTGRKRGEYLEQRSALQEERTELQLKPVHE